MTEPMKFGKYEVKRELGRGAAGIIYEGIDPFIQRPVAIKIIQKSMVNESEAPDVFNRFRHEAQAAGRMTHPNIVSIYEYGEENDISFIAMELVQGKDLKEYFDNQRRFEMPDCTNIMRQLLDALEYSHSRGVVHRDIKPSNIMITQDGQVKVADFGIAKIESSDLTQAGDVLGTPTYMSPEQFIGVAVDHRSDIYSAGVILYQFLAGERPFTGSMTSIMHKVLHQAPVPPSSLNPNVSSTLNAVVNKAMAKRPEDRFQTAAEFWQALKLATQSSHGTKTEESNQESTQKLSAIRPADTDATVLLPKSDGSGTLPPDNDLEYWKRIKNSANPQDFIIFIGKFPNSEFAALAKQHSTQLENSITRARAEEKRKWEIEQKLKQEAAEQAERAQRYTALKAAADAKLKEEAAEQARRTQKMAALAAQRETELKRIAAEKIRQQPTPSSKEQIQYQEITSHTTETVVVEVKPESRGLFKSLLSIFGIGGKPDREVREKR